MKRHTRTQGTQALRTLPVPVDEQKAGQHAARVRVLALLVGLVLFLLLHRQLRHMRVAGQLALQIGGQRCDGAILRAQVQDQSGRMKYKVRLVEQRSLAGS